MNGQNARRPPIRSSAGRSVSIATAAIATPIAPTGPSPAVEFTRASERQSNAAITVPAEATMAGPPCRSATRIAAYSVLDALELLAVAGGQEQGVVGARAEDEDEEDAPGLPVDDHSGVGQERSEPSHDRLGEQHREERQHPEDRAAVDEDEQHEDEHRPSRRGGSS